MQDSCSRHLEGARMKSAWCASTRQALCDRSRFEDVREIEADYAIA